MQADEEWALHLPMPPGVEPGIAAHHGVGEWPLSSLDSFQSSFPGAFDSSQDVQQQDAAERDSSAYDSLVAAGLLVAAAEDTGMPLPAQIHVNREGKVGVCKNVAFCSQVGWKEGCVGGVGEFRGGNDKHNTRYRYECLSCGNWWSQIRPDRLQPGQDPEIRPVVFNEKRKAYRCGKCRLFCVPSKAAAAGEMRYCTCPRSEKTKRHTVPASMQCAMLIDSMGEDTDGDTLGLPSLSANRMGERESQIHEARVAAQDAIRISSLKPMRGGGSPLDPVQAAPVLATPVVTPLQAAPAAPPPPEPLAAPVVAAPVETASEIAEVASTAQPEPRAKPVSKIRIIEEEMNEGGQFMTRDITTVTVRKQVALPHKARKANKTQPDLTPHQLGLPFLPKSMMRAPEPSRSSNAGEKRYREDSSDDESEPESEQAPAPEPEPAPAPESESEAAPAPEPEPESESEPDAESAAVETMEEDEPMQAPPSEPEPNCRCFKCRRVLDDHHGQTIEPCIPCSRRTCDTWSCFKCAGFKTRAQMNSHKGAWYCCKKRK